MNIIREEWQKLVTEYIKENFGEDRDYLGGDDFRYNVSIKFEDGTHAFFKDAFYIINEEIDEVAIFTEHYGYHYFPFRWCEVALLNNVTSDYSADE